jgi:hypothetical protein
MSLFSYTRPSQVMALAGDPARVSGRSIENAEFGMKAKRELASPAADAGRLTKNDPCTAPNQLPRSIAKSCRIDLNLTFSSIRF